MSITSTMYTGVSGLTAEGDALGVVGDNIANSKHGGLQIPARRLRGPPRSLDGKSRARAPVFE